MINTVYIGGSPIGDGHSTIIVSEQGINNSGDVEIAKKLIDVSIECGVNATKFQTRTVDVVYSPEELSRPRESPFGETNGDLKRGLEFNKEEYREIDSYCKERGLTWWSSAWNEEAVDFLAEFDLPCFKIASACLTDDNLLKHHLQYKKPIILSTGMSSYRQVDHAVDVLGTDNLIILHCTSTYPSVSEELNLRCIQELKSRYGIPIGYSGHELGLATTIAAVVLGACMIERHICLNRADWGSDMSASVEPQGIKRLVRDVREVEKALGDGIKVVYDSEKKIIKKLRRVDTMKLEGI